MCKYSEKEMLHWLLERGNISSTTIEREMDMNKRQEYLETHKGKIWEGKNGKWYTLLPDPKKKRRLIKRNTRSAIEDAIVDFYRGEEQYCPTFGEAFITWVDNKLKYGEICKGTYDRYKNEYNRYLNDTDFAYTKISKITEYDIENMLRDNIREKNLTRKAFAGLRTLVIGVFKYAKRMKYTELSISYFFQDLELSKKMFKRETKESGKQVFSEDETPILLKYLDNHPEELLYLGIELDFYTGLRSGELVALKFSDVENDMLHVQRQQIRETDEEGNVVYKMVDYTKTEQGDRYVYLNKEAVNIIRKIRLKNPFSEYMFPDTKKHCFNNKLYRACKRCGIAPRSMHKIRKTYGTMLIDNGVDDSLVMSQMGHKDIQTTRSYYYYARKNNKHQREQIERALNY